MLPKRKLIKKLRSQQKPNLNFQQTQVQSHQSLFDKLKSINPAVKQQAVSILANLHVMMPEFLQPQFTLELVNLLYQANSSLVHHTIFAMANLCQIEPGLIKKLFEQGLDKALVHLPSSNNELLKPILIFFITVSQNLPQKYHYLLQGIRNSLTVQHFKFNPQLCLEFLFRTYNVSTQKLSQQIIGTIVSIYKGTQSIPQKSYALAIMSKQLEGSKQLQQILINYLTELLVCIDLAKQYEMNFSTLTNNKVSQVNKMSQKQNNEQQMQEDNQQQNEQCGIQSKVNTNKKLSIGDRQKLKFFNQTISGIQILLQFVLDLLENQDQQWSQQKDQEIDQQQDMDQQLQNNLNNKVKSSQLRPLLLQFIKQNMTIFPKFLSLSSTIVPDTQNIVYLFYHLLMNIDKHLQSQQPDNKNNLTQINQLIQVSLQNLFGSLNNGAKNQQQSNISIEQYEILVQCLQIGLGVLMKNKGVGVRQDWLIKFSKTYMMQSAIFKSNKLLQQIKPCWLIMLQLYSKALNPQKNNKITEQQNYELGQILKNLIISLPYQQLQQFRCQVIDTLFDVYSNENFDRAFVKLGFVELLQTIIKQGNNIIKKQNKIKNKNKNKYKKQQKFIQDVLKDVKRFLQYKYKMIQK